MLSDTMTEADHHKALRKAKQEAKRLYGRPCPDCLRLLPKASPSNLLPGEMCKAHGYRDPRPRTAENSYLTEGEYT